MTNPPRLAHVCADGTGETDACLRAAAALLAARGVRLAGTVQSNPTRPGRRRCDMNLHVLPDGPELRISQDRGDAASGCRLDGEALEMAVPLVLAGLSRAELVLVNKFGKQELSGRGMVPVIAEAVQAGLPVIVGVGRTNLPAWLAFAGQSQALPADPEAVAGWALAGVQA